MLSNKSFTMSFSKLFLVWQVILLTLIVLFPKMPIGILGNNTMKNPLDFFNRKTIL